MRFPNAECTELGNVLSHDVLWLPLASSETKLVGHGQTVGHAVVFLRFGLKYRFFSPHPTPFLFHGLLLILRECLHCLGALSAWTSSPQACRANHSSGPLPRYRLLHETDPDSPASNCNRDIPASHAVDVSFQYATWFSGLLGLLFTLCLPS